MNGSSVTNLPGLKKLFPGFKFQEAKEHLPLPVEAHSPIKFKKKDPCFCALAWSVMLFHNPMIKPFIFRSTAYLVDVKQETITRYLLGPKERELISHFDETGEFKPGTYRLTAPTETAKLAFKPTGTRTPGTGKSGRTRKSAVAPRVAYLGLG